MISAADASLYAFRRNVVVSASAGTGKTFRLVTLYSLLVLGLTSLGASDDETAGKPVGPSRIAATTFSRAAAAEIRERVLRVLRAVATGERTADLAAYCAIFDARARATGSPAIGSRVLRERAERALHELPGALIDTLHGLAGRLVRGSAFELGLSPSFTVLDEEQARATTDAAIEQVLTSALAAGDRAATDLLDAAGGLSLARQRIAELLDRADEEGLAWPLLGSPDFAAQARRAMDDLSRICGGLLSETSKAYGEPAAEVARAVADWQCHGRMPASASDPFERLFAVRARAKPLPSEEAFVSFKEGIRGETNAHRARRFLAFVDAAPELGARTVAMASLIATIAARRGEARSRASSLGFGDLLRTARDALRDRPEVAAAGRQTWDVLLVDEFQDTSRVQRDLVYLLRERGHRAARAPHKLPSAQDLERGGLLVVGDRKQSIYGFRGADVTVFTRVAVELCGEAARDGLALGSGFAVPPEANAEFVTLSENRRSLPTVLSFVNAFAREDFASATPQAFDITYAPSEHLRPVLVETSERPARVVMVDDDGEVPAGAPPMVRSATGAMREALLAAALIEREVRAAEGGLRFGDIAVLARRRSTLPLIEFALARLEIPYLVAGRGLYDTREVRDLFAVLRMLVDPFDRDALAVVMRGPALALRDASLARLSRVGSGLALPDEWFRGDARLADGLEPCERERVARFHQRLSSLSRTCVGLGPAETLRLCLCELQLDQVMAALPRPAPRLANVERLVAIASARGGSLPSFVRWLDRQIADETNESEAATLSAEDDAVALMTIHASKGLEFRAVVTVDLSAAPRTTPVSLALEIGAGGSEPRLMARHTQPDGSSLYTPGASEFARQALARDIAERKRLTYVAFTRARERLYLIVPAQTPQGSAAATLRRMATGSSAESGIERIAAADLLTGGSAVPPVHSVPSRAPDVVGARDGERGALSISTTPLVTFDQCARRYRLVHELGQDPPAYGRHAGAVSTAGAVAARAAVLASERKLRGSAAHRVLETLPIDEWGEPIAAYRLVERLVAEGLAESDPGTLELATRIAMFVQSDYARRVRENASDVRREEPFVLQLAAGAGWLSLRGAIDLLAIYPDRSADVIDYKSSWRDGTEVPFQLRVYALAARRCMGVSAVRAAIVDLGGSAEVKLAPISDAELDAFEVRLLLLRRRFLQFRHDDDFPGVAAPRCHELRCGFVAACHRAT